MQILGLSDSTTKPEGSRVKALLWPTIRHEYDADYICQQGFWVCTILSVMTLGYGIFAGSPAVSLIFAVFFFLGGVGVRQCSRFAAIAVFAYYLLSVLEGGLGAVGVLGIITLALLLANVRGTWLTARWRAATTEPPPVRVDQTVTDRISNQWPVQIWPIGKWLFYFMAVVLAGLTIVGMVMLRRNSPAA